MTGTAVKMQGDEDSDHREDMDEMEQEPSQSTIDQKLVQKEQGGETIQPMVKTARIRNH